MKVHFDELNCFGRMMELRLKQQRTTKIAEFLGKGVGFWSYCPDGVVKVHSTADMIKLLWKDDRITAKIVDLWNLLELQQRLRYSYNR